MFTSLAFSITFLIVFDRMTCNFLYHFLLLSLWILFLVFYISEIYFDKRLYGCLIDYNETVDLVICAKYSWILTLEEGGLSQRSIGSAQISNFFYTSLLWLYVVSATALFLRFFAYFLIHNKGISTFLLSFYLKWKYGFWN